MDLREVFDEDELNILSRLVANGGAMHQQTLVGCVDYSEGKLSELVTALAEDGHLRKIQYGRGNVLYLPGSEPALVHDAPAGDDESAATAREADDE